MALMPEAEVDRRLTSLPGWERDGQQIRKEYSFGSYMDGIAFVNRVAGLAEKMDHHPDMLVGYRRVTLTLSSHDAGGITARDLRLAEAIDS
jgi:4a-hydroxytetrahydrobiopterin dehydratase